MMLTTVTMRKGVILLFLLLLAACGGKRPSPPVTPIVEEGETAVPLSTSTPILQETATPIPPSPIPASPTPSEPLAAMVNGRPILLATYEQELARRQQAQPDETVGRAVLDALIEQEIILQAAEEQGITVPTAVVDARLAELKAKSDNFEAWLVANQWESEEAFRDVLADEMVVGLLADAVTADVPYTAPHARARIIQFANAADAQSVLAELAAGAKFSTMAQYHSINKATAPNGGDIGYFAQGSLTIPEIEAAAFGLELNAYSDLITVTAGDGTQAFYLVQLIDLDEQRPLTAEMRYPLLTARFDAWLAQKWEETAVERFIEK